jgi:trans-aconitate methyltransferase
VSSPNDPLIHLYERHAAAYDQLRGRSLVERHWLDRYCAVLQPGATILDLGCGMGEPIAQHFLAQGYRVTGVDAAPAMIARCRARFPHADWLAADMRQLSLGRRFDAIIAWDSLFHLSRDEQRALFPVLGAHAAPRAALLFTSGPADGESIGTFEGEPLYHASLDAAEYRRLLAEQGFVVREHAVEDPDCGGHTVWLAQRESRGGT